MSKQSTMPNLLRAARQLARLSQSELAAKSGVPKHVIHRLETGKTKRLTYDDAVKLARALRTQPHDIFDVEVAQLIAES